LLALRGRGSIGYYKDERKTASLYRVIDGEKWRVPGDWATVENDGTVRLLGRGSLCINTGGEKVFPEEVEEAIKRHPRVADAVVVGVPDPRFNEVVGAIIEWRNDGPSGDQIPPTREELVTWVRRFLADYKTPRHVVTVQTIGRGANGKADYSALRKAALAQLGMPEHAA
jgi:fatty-acyl-CoA synthase